MAYDRNTPTPSGAQLAFVVAVLKGTGHYAGGEVTEWTPEVEDALRKYQIDRRLSVSGVMDQATAGDMARVIGFVGGADKDPVYEYIVTNYGPGFATMLGHEEIGVLLRRAEAEKWTSDTLAEAVKQTSWYRRQSDQQRMWEALKVENPAEADRRRREREAIIWDQANQLGVKVDPRLIRQLTEDSLAFGWSEAQTNDTLTGFITYDPKAPEGKGDTAVTISQLKDYARQYHVILTDQQAWQMAQRILRDETTIEAQIVTFKQQAKARYAYGGLAELIDRGVTPEDYFANHKNLMARELELNPESIDFTDPKWSAVLGKADAKGVMRPMTLTETVEELRSMDNRYGWWDTAQAGQQAASVALDLREMFTGQR